MAWIAYKRKLRYESDLQYDLFFGGKQRPTGTKTNIQPPAAASFAADAVQISTYLHACRDGIRILVRTTPADLVLALDSTYFCGGWNGWLPAAIRTSEHRLQPEH